MSTALTPEQSFRGWSHLWRQRLRVLLANLANGQREHREISIIAKHIRADYAGRFLVELLQNASDQATKAQLHSSKVTILRTENLLAITNEGMPFDQLGIDSITSLGLSPKDPEFAIGNKGVGFKSVFEVSASPEVISAPSLNATFKAPNGIRFRLHEQPFDTPLGAKLLEQLVDELLGEQPGTAADIAQLHPNQPARDVVLHEARHAAPFKYPLPIDDLELTQRLSALSLPEEASNAQTLVILPLLAQTREIVNTALNGLIGPKQHSPGAILLFLPAITRIEIIDRVREQVWSIERHSTTNSRRLPRGSLLGTTSTSRWLNPHTDATRHRQETAHWWIASRTLGDENSSDQLRYSQEYAALEEATRHLPGQGWARIRSTTVSAALPQMLTTEPRPLGTHGRFCIALPTLLLTGSPFWVDARFHGKLDRTTIDFKSLRFNALLLHEAVLLAGDIINSHKAATQPEIRRHAALALERSTGELSDALYAANGLAHQEVVDSHDHQRFLRASEMSLPSEEDFWLLEKAKAAIDSLELYGFFIPDKALLTYARSVLEGLPGAPRNSSSHESRWLMKPAAHQTTLLEACARHYRKSGTDFWEPFLKRIARFPLESLRLLSLLPVGIDGLAPPSSNVFFAPTAGAGTPFDDDEVEEVPELVRQDLRFFDEHTIRVRERGRAYTQVAKQLVDSKLVFSPRREPLLRDALLPALAEHSAHPQSRNICLRLLYVAGQWVLGLSDFDRSKIDLKSLAFPVRGPDGKWMWIQSKAIYLGPGWSEEYWDRLLNQAYGHTPERRLIPWAEFKEALTEAGFTDPDLVWWRNFALKSGIWSHPITWVPTTNPGTLLQHTRQGPWRIADACPLRGPEALWKRYLQHAASLLNQAKSIGTFSIQTISWIDGLERDESRSAIVEMLLHRAQDGFETNIISQNPHRIISTIPVLWAFALKTENWPIIPTDVGLATVDEAWLPEPTESHERYRFLKAARAEVKGAKLLNWLGVTTLSGAITSSGQTTRAINALQHLASQLPSIRVEHLRHAKLLSMELWQLLQLQCAQQQKPSLARLLDRPVPLLRGEQLLSLNLSEVQLLLIDDDPIRARYFSHPPNTYTLPVSSRAAVHALTDSLQTLLGATRVRSTSTIPVDTGFVDLVTPTPFIDFLTKEDPKAALHLALLLAYGANEEALGHDSAFPQHWNVLSRTTLRRGQFGTNFPGDVFVDSQGGHTEILANLNLSIEQTLHKADTLFSQDRRYSWSRYVTAIMSKPRRIEDFYATLRVGDIELHAAERLLLRTGILLTQPLLAYALARWRRTHHTEPLQGFLQEWTTRANTLQALCTWLDLSTTIPAPHSSSSHMDDATVLTALSTFEISATEWQAARAELGLERWRFEESREFLEDVREAMAAAICAWAAVPRRAPRDDIRVLVERLRSLSTDHESCELPVDAARQQILPVVLKAAIELATENAHRLSSLLEKLRNLEERIALTTTDINLGTPQREIDSYRNDPPPLREQRALAARESLLKIASALSIARGDKLDLEFVRRTPEVQELSQGWWANPYSALRAVHQSLENIVPSVATRMSEQHAFRDLYPDWRNLWARFPELGPLDQQPPHPPPPPTVQVLGTARSINEVLQDARLGPHGPLGKQLLPFVNVQPPLSALHTHERVAVSALSSPPSPSLPLTRDNRMEKRGRQLEADRTVYGMLGEFFVYEYLQKQLPDFTADNWVSENRSQYGLEDTGQDSLGYDFVYFDHVGALADIPKTHCLIEVKSSTAPNPTTFFMSLNQWEKAQECHASSHYKYIILIVGSVHEDPRLVDKIVDPVAYQEAGKLRLIADEFRVQLGPGDTTR